MDTYANKRPKHDGPLRTTIGNKKNVIVSTNTIADERAMMIKFRDTPITNAAMLRTNGLVIYVQHQEQTGENENATY